MEPDNLRPPPTYALQASLPSFSTVPVASEGLDTPREPQQGAAASDPEPECQDLSCSDNPSVSIMSTVLALKLSRDPRESSLKLLGTADKFC